MSDGKTSRQGAGQSADDGTGLSPRMEEPMKPDLSGYSVQIHSGLCLHSWTVTCPDGSEIDGSGQFLNRSACEVDALGWMKAHATPPVSIPGDKLAALVEDCGEYLATPAAIDALGLDT